MRAARGRARYASGKAVLVFWRKDSGLPPSSFTESIPCGQCVGCRLEYSRQWAMRCMDEAQMHSENSFITLTYNNDNSGDCRTIVKRDLQLFFKRLRKSVGRPGLRYYAAAEYTAKLRPHFHVLLFGCDFADKYYFKMSYSGKQLFRSPSLEKVWTYGHSYIGSVTFESAAYVARYCMKKVTGIPENDKFSRDVEDAGLAPEFVVMSRGCKKLKTGGIGRSWFEKYTEDVFPLDRKVVRGKEMKPPRYYASLYERDHPVEMELIKRDRKNAVDIDDNNVYRLAAKEEVAFSRLKLLSRDLEDL